MSAVASKNLYDLLGNDIEDENEVPAPVSKEVVKQPVTSKKRDEAPVKPAATEGGRGDYGNRRGRGDGNDAAFRDRGAGRANNRNRPTDAEGAQGEPRRGGMRSSNRGKRDYDRHSATGKTDSDKQVSQGWGSTKGTSEWDDEKAGESIAQADATEEPFVPLANPEGEPAVTTEAGEPAAAIPEPEVEDNTKSYADYLAEKAKKAPIADLPEARAPNEGSREDKKWAAAKKLEKEEDDVYFASANAKSKTAKQRKEKTVIEIDPRFTEPSRRGGDRGDRGRGGRGGRGGDRGGRGGRGGGEFRGERRPYQGGRGGANGATVNIEDSNAFPSLGQ